MNTTTFSSTTVDQVEGMGTITRTYTEAQAQSGAGVFTEITTTETRGAPTTVYILSILHSPVSGKWFRSATTREGGQITIEDDSIVDETWTSQWIRNRRSEHYNKADALRAA